MVVLVGYSTSHPLYGGGGQTSDTLVTLPCLYDMSIKIFMINTCIHGKRFSPPPPQGRGKISCPRKLTFRISAGTNIITTMKLVMIMSTFLNGNISTDHFSLSIIQQSTDASMIGLFEI
jgi:hypothetical protein